MVYVTVKQPPKYHQMTLEEFLFGAEPKNLIIDPNTTNTRTYVTKHVNNKLLDRINVFGLIQSLQEFNEMAGNIHNRQRETLYNTFYIAKKGKGMPYIFKKIFAMQSKYIECDSSAVFKMCIRDRFYSGGIGRHGSASSWRRRITNQMSTLMITEGGV